jgi:nicotinamidase-related amidase
MGVAQQVSEGFFDLFPHRVAVVMVDFQNDFCSPEVFGGGPVTNTRNAEAAQRASTFAAHAAGLGAHVVYTQQILDMGQLTARQRRWERPEGLCAAGTWGAGLFVEPVRGSSVVVKYRYDCWRSPSFTGFLDGKDIDGLVICGVELICCVLYAVLGAAERGYHYMVPQDLVSGQDPGTETGDKAVRDYLRFGHPQHAIESSEEILSRWRARTGVLPRGGLSAETGAVSERLRVREIDDDEGQRLVRIIRRGTGSVVTWRRAQMVLLSAQGMDAAGIAKVAFTSEDRVRDGIRNFNADGFSSL